MIISGLTFYVRSRARERATLMRLAGTRQALVNEFLVLETVSKFFCADYDEASYALFLPVFDWQAVFRNRFPMAGTRIYIE